MISLDKDVASLSREDRLAGLHRIIPGRLIGDVLKEAGEGRRCSRLPTRFMVHFVLAMGLFCRDCYRQVFRWLRPWHPGGVPARTTLCEARKRLGVRPLVALARRVVRLLAQRPAGPDDGGVSFYRGMRLMALDGFVVDVPDSEANGRAFGRPGSDRGRAAFPQVQVVALCEVGTHVMWRWLIKPCTWDERPMADRLLRDLAPDMLLLWDRNFLSYERVKAVAQRGAHLLARINNWPIFQPIRRLSDGSFLAKLYRTPTDRKHDRDGIVVRIIEYTFDDPNRPGFKERHRLLTTLLDDQTLDDPAARLIELYHERWEEELVIDEIKTHEMERPALRSQTPAGVIQELYALILDHFVVRALMYEAAMRAGVEPRRLSFTATVKILRCRIPQCPMVGDRAIGHWWENLVAEVSEERLEPRRNRINPRVIKRKYSKWKVKRPHHRHYPQPSKHFRDNIVMLR
jgi:hypothetical protein